MCFCHLFGSSPSQEQKTVPNRINDFIISKQLRQEKVLANFQGNLSNQFFCLGGIWSFLSYLPSQKNKKIESDTQHPELEGIHKVHQDQLLSQG